MRSEKVIIVGAGLAGLSAAYTLKKAGIGSVIVEARGDYGTRCRSYWDDGYMFFAGAGSTEPQWSTTWEYIDEFGITPVDATKTRYGWMIDGKLRTISMGLGLKSLAEFVKFFFTGWPRGTYIQLVKAFKNMMPYMKGMDIENHNLESLAPIADQSAEEWIVAHGGQKASDWFFHSLLSTMVLGRASDICIAHPITLFSLMQGTYTLEGGMGILSEKLFEQVGNQVIFNTPVDEIRIEDGKATGIVIGGEFIEADHVICCTDAVDALKLMPGLPQNMRAQLETCRYSSTYYYQFGLKKPLVDNDQTKDTNTLVVMYEPNADTHLCLCSLGHPDTEHPVVTVATRGWLDDELTAMSDEDRRRLVIRDIQKVCPEFPDEPYKERCFRWDRAINLEAPGQFNAINDFKANHQFDVKDLYFAGEYLFLIASTEGAMHTGKLAAQKLVEDINKRDAEIAAQALREEIEKQLS